MAIKKVKISNFKSFKDLEIELGKFNVLIGTNASGKSNFVQILKFLRDITNYHLDNAISMQGGIEYLRNLNIGSSQNLLVEVVSDQRYNTPPVRGKEKELIGMVTYETIYRFIIKFKRRGPGFEIVEDKLTQKVEFFKLGRRGRESEGGALSGNGEIVFSNDKEKISVDFLGFPPEVGPLKEHYIFLSFLKEAKLGPRTLLIERLPSFVMPPIFGEISIYDFDPKLPKKAIPITGRAEIEEDGNNLAIVLKNIIEDKEKKRKLFNLVKDLLPFVDELDVEKFADKSLLFKLREIYAKKQYLPASLISDGTINITALIIALYFTQKWLTVIEEPERNIHPYLISKVVDMMKDASQKKQIIVTTHNHEIVKHAGLENILLISRDNEGFSIISKPHEKETVKTFLKNELGIEDLYIHNLLDLKA